MYKIMILQKPLNQFPPNFALILGTVEMWLIVYSNDYAPLTVRPIYSSKLRTAQMIFSLVAMIGLEKYCITSAYLQWLCHSGERVVAHGPLVFYTPGMPNAKFVCQKGYSFHPFCSSIRPFFLPSVCPDVIPSVNLFYNPCFTSKFLYACLKNRTYYVRGMASVRL